MAGAVAEVDEPTSSISVPLVVTGVAVVILGAAALVFLSSGRRRRQQVKQQKGTVDEQ